MKTSLIVLFSLGACFGLSVGCGADSTTHGGGGAAGTSNPPLGGSPSEAGDGSGGSPLSPSAGRPGQAGAGASPAGGEAGSFGTAGEADGGVGGMAGAGGEPTRSTLRDGLVGWWRAEGDARDSVGTNHGTLEGAVTFSAGKIGQAFEFDGTDAVTVPSSTSLDVLQGYSVAFWIKSHAWPSSEALLLNKFVNAAEDKLVGIEPSGNVSFYLHDVMHQARLNSTKALSTDTWHHLATTYDGAHSTIYIDGILDAFVAATGNLSNSSGALAFGFNTGRSGSWVHFVGELDEIRWYTRALSASEVALLASGGT
jgi:hypothetical protein